MHALRSKYFLTYVAYALSCGICDPKLLPDFGKRDFLRSQRPIPPRVEVLEDWARSSPHSASIQEQGESSSKNENRRARRGKLTLLMDIHLY